MSYKVVLRPSAQRDLKRLSHDLHNRVLDVLLALQSQPRPTGVKKLQGQVNQWRIRIGVLRILYEIYDGEKLVRIFRIAHRRDVYR